MAKGSITDEQYSIYKKKYHQLDKQGLISPNAEKLTRKEFGEYIKSLRGVEDPAFLTKSGKFSISKARDQLLGLSYKFGNLSGKDIQNAYNYYRKEVTGVYYNNIAEFKANTSAHDMIKYLIDSGMTRDETLKEFGY